MDRFKDGEERMDRLIDGEESIFNKGWTRKDRQINEWMERKAWI